MRVRIGGRRRSDTELRIDRRLLRRRATAALRALGREDAELSITLADDFEIAALNEAWRSRRGPTDVLSFSLLEGPHAEHRGTLLGEVVIGVDVAARQARRARRSLDDEAARLLVHGVLHLVGHDHVRSAEARRMRSEERRLRRALPA
ncbi:Endoribonuclease YbeY [Myxococcaceae bacterium]|nr:Endoribonuclease YbeY [Myxococcaceae bacterium]